MAVVIGLVGNLASGKGTAARYLAEQHGAIIVRYSDSLREALGIFDLPVTRENMQNLSTVMRQNFGENVLARAVARRARLAKDTLVVVDGVRRLTDIEGLGQLPGFNLVALTVEQQMRYQRCVKRNENDGDAEMSFEKFKERDTAEAEVQIPQVMTKAQFNIDNSGTIEDFHRKIDGLVEDVNAARPQASFVGAVNMGNV